MHFIYNYIIQVIFTFSLLFSTGICLTIHNGLADFSDEKSTARELKFESRNISAIDTQSMDHFTSLSILYLTKNHLTEFPDLSPVANTLWRLRVRANPSISTAGNVELAVLKKIRYLDIKETNITLLTSTCPESTSDVYSLRVDLDRLDLCNCQMIWMKVILQFL